LVHLDVHGAVELAAAPGVDFVASDVVLALERESIRGQELETLLADASVELFTTNACFAAQHRVLAAHPFPGRLVQRGPAAALAFRDPLAATVARAFFTGFFGELGGGHVITDAVRAGHRSQMAEAKQAPPNERADELARCLVQPNLWLRDLSDAGMRFSTPSAEAFRGAPYLGDC
jgi:hypothetical protein